MPHTRRRRRITLLAGLAACLSWPLYALLRPAPDTTPEGAYMRVASAISGGDARDAFAYMDEESQHAAYTIGNYASKAAAAIRKSYPASERAKALAPYAALAQAKDGPAVWVTLAIERGWITRLRRDLSGVVKVEIDGERASLTTARGTRYPFRKRPNGIWGLTLFTAELSDEAKRMARHCEAVETHAEYFERATSAGSASQAPSAAP
jgi:hypothetical protein